MDNWSKIKSRFNYSRWRNPDQRFELDFVGHKDEDQATDNEICTTTRVRGVSGCREPATTATTSTAEATFTLDEALEAIGFGKFQFKLSLLTGLSWIGDAMEMMILSILGPQLHCEWRLPSIQVALITLAVFAGMALSAAVWGNMSDRYGRKKGLVMCMCWTLYYGLLSAFAPVYGWLLVLRGLVGFGIGGAPQSVTLYSEFLPVKTRGVCIMLIAGFWALGAVFEVLLALLVMPSLGWRWLLGLSTIPIAAFVCLCFWMPESPRFDVLMGKRENAMATLTRIANENGSALPPGKLIVQKQKPQGQLKDILTPQYRRTTLLLWFIWFVNAFSYYGIVLLTTELFQSRHLCGMVQGAKIEPKCSLDCKYLTTADYKDLLWTTLAEFPGLLIVLAVDRIGRRKSMAVCFFIFFLFVLPLFACIGRVAVLICIFISRAFISGGYQVVFVYTPEVYPTETRALGMGTSSAMARLGSIITPFVAQVLLRRSLYLTLALYCGCGLLACVASLQLPVETSGRSLQESSTDREAGTETPQGSNGRSNGTAAEAERDEQQLPRTGGHVMTSLTSVLKPWTKACRRSGFRTADNEA